MRTLVDALKDYQKRRSIYLKRINFFLKLIKNRAKKLLGKNTKVFLFGSYLKGTFKLTSDVDILIVSNKVPEDPYEMTKIKVEIIKDFKPGHPFEIHLTNYKNFNNWYKRFIKKDLKEI